MCKVYGTSLALLTDLYQLTMAYGYWKHDMHNQHAAFNLFYRKNPFGAYYTVAAGLETVIEYINQLYFSPTDIQFLRSLTGNDGKQLFEEDFLSYLHTFRFACDVRAMEEGTIAFPHEPLLSIQGPLIQCQLLETPLLNAINFSTLIATKAQRICSAAEGPVLEFGLRRAQGIDGALTASRAAYIGGCAATSNVLAGKLYNIPVKGTHAHSWVMSFDTEMEAFDKYAQAMPNNSVMLVDTYDTMKGVDAAITIGEKLREQGHELVGIRLDSGDLAKLSIEARKKLDAAGFEDAKIVASNDLDEYTIQELKIAGAQIDIWGIGTKLATAYDQPALGGVYKLGAIRDKQGHWHHKIKLSEERIKTSNPGAHQVFRFHRNGAAEFDIIFDTLSGFVTGGDYVPEHVFGDELTHCPARNELDTLYACHEMLPVIFDKGTLVYKSSLESARKRLQDARFKLNHKGHPVALDANMHRIKNGLMK